MADLIYISTDKKANKNGEWKCVSSAIIQAGAGIKMNHSLIGNVSFTKVKLAELCHVIETTDFEPGATVEIRTEDDYLTNNGARFGHEGDDGTREKYEDLWNRFYNACELKKICPVFKYKGLLTDCVHSEGIEYLNSLMGQV